MPIDPRLAALGLTPAPEAAPAYRAQRLRELGVTAAADPDWIAAASTNVAAFRWVADDPYPLQVRFLSGAAYGYLASEDVYEGLLFAPSKGRFVARVLKKNGYPVRRLA